MMVFGSMVFGSSSRCSALGVVLVSTLVSMILTSGCATPPSRFYILRPLAPASEASTEPLRDIDDLLAVGPISVPKSIDRPQIVTISGGHLLELHEFERWGEPLVDNLARVIAENVRRLAPHCHATGSVWARRAATGRRLVVDVKSLEIVPGGEVTLEAAWAILDRDEKIVEARRSRVLAAVDGDDFEAKVAAVSRAIAELCEEIASVL